MNDEVFDPWKDKMPWDDSDDSAVVSDNEHVVDADDENEDGAAPVAQKADIFTALEQKLNIPLGSTAEALHPHKQITERIKHDANKLDLQNKMLSVQLNAGRLTPETFDQARAKVMHDALRMVDIANNFIDKMQNQLDSTVDITDKMWAAASSMITSVITAIEKLDKITKNIRQEEELRQIELQKIADAKKALDDDGTMELVPSQTNAVIFQIIEEEEKKRNKELGIITDGAEEQNEDSST